MTLNKFWSADKKLAHSEDDEKGKPQDGQEPLKNNVTDRKKITKVIFSVVTWILLIYFVASIISALLSAVFNFDTCLTCLPRYSENTNIHLKHGRYLIYDRNIASDLSGNSSILRKDKNVTNTKETLNISILEQVKTLTDKKIIPEKEVSLGDTEHDHASEDKMSKEKSVNVHEYGSKHVMSGTHQIVRDPPNKLKIHFQLPSKKLENNNNKPDIPNTKKIFFSENFSYSPDFIALFNETENPSAKKIPLTNLNIKSFFLNLLNKYENRDNGFKDNIVSKSFPKIRVLKFKNISQPKAMNGINFPSIFFQVQYIKTEKLNNFKKHSSPFGKLQLLPVFKNLRKYHLPSDTESKKLIKVSLNPIDIENVSKPNLDRLIDGKEAVGENTENLLNGSIYKSSLMNAYVFPLISLIRNKLKNYTLTVSPVKDSLAIKDDHEAPYFKFDPSSSEDKIFLSLSKTKFGRKVLEERKKKAKSVSNIQLKPPQVNHAFKNKSKNLSQTDRNLDENIDSLPQYLTKIQKIGNRPKLHPNNDTNNKNKGHTKKVGTIPIYRVLRNSPSYIITENKYLEPYENLQTDTVKLQNSNETPVTKRYLLDESTSENENLGQLFPFMKASKMNEKEHFESPKKSESFHAFSTSVTSETENLESGETLKTDFGKVQNSDEFLGMKSYMPDKYVAVKDYFNQPILSEEYGEFDEREQFQYPKKSEPFHVFPLSETSEVENLESYETLQTDSGQVTNLNELLDISYMPDESNKMKDDFRKPIVSKEFERSHENGQFESQKNFHAFSSSVTSETEKFESYETLQTDSGKVQNSNELLGTKTYTPDKSVAMADYYKQPIFSKELDNSDEEEQFKYLKISEPSHAFPLGGISETENLQSYETLHADSGKVQNSNELSGVKSYTSDKSVAVNDYFRLPVLSNEFGKSDEEEQFQHAKESDSFQASHLAETSETENFESYETFQPDSSKAQNSDD